MQPASPWLTRVGMDQLLLDLTHDTARRLREGSFNAEDFQLTYDRIIDAQVERVDGAVRVPLTQGKFALVDEADWPRLRQHSWFAMKDQNKRDCYYARAKIKRRSVSLHRFILGVTDAEVRVDHINNDTLDCRRSNLRRADKWQSAQNRRSWTSRKRTHQHHSPFKGVYARVRKNNTVLVGWRSVIKARKIAHELGTFPTQEEAARAYDRKALELHGEYANLNFPRSDYVTEDHAPR